MDFLDAFCEAAYELRDLPLPERDAAFVRLMEPVLQRIEAEGRESGDAAEMVARADRLWAVARDLGIIDRPPPTMVTN
jgi:hypothetical protein